MYVVQLCISRDLLAYLMPMLPGHTEASLGLSQPLHGNIPTR